MCKQVGALRFLLYAAMGAIGTLAHYLVLAASVSMGWLGPPSASACGALAGAVVNFLLNARFTFRSAASWQRAGRFVATAALAAAANGLAMAGLTGWLQLAWLPAQVIVTACLLVLTFYINSLWTFRPDRTS